MPWRRYDHGMFGGKKKRRDLEQQIRDAALEGQHVQAPSTTGGSDQSPATPAPAHQSRVEALIEAALERNPMIAGNPAVAASMSELIREARQDPKGFAARMRELAAENGTTAFTLTSDGIAPVRPGGGTVPGPLPGHFGPPTGDPAGPMADRSPGTGGAPGTWGLPGTGGAVNQPGHFGPTGAGQTGASGLPGTSGAAGQPGHFGTSSAGQAGAGTFPPAADPRAGTGRSGNPLQALDDAAARFNRGEMTQAEFEAEKRRILGG